MRWFDGTFTWTPERMERDFPRRIAGDLRLSEDGSELAVINRFEEDSPYYDPAAPDLTGKEPFYHVFTGEEAAPAENAVREFVRLHGEGGGAVSLVRQDPDRLYLYAHGTICADALSEQARLREQLRLDPEGETFILPLRRYLYPCPVCREPTLEYRGCCVICQVCGWEDDGTDDDDAETLIHPYHTIQSYREEYLAKKRQAEKRGEDA